MYLELKNARLNRFMYIYNCNYICVNMYREREREREMNSNVLVEENVAISHVEMWSMFPY